MNIYRFLSFLNDLEALERGPAPFAKRMIRKVVYRVVFRSLRAVFRAVGLM